MSLIKCKNCGEKISDKSTKCVHCGYDTKYSITYFCPECGKEYDNISCLNCGYRNKNDNKEKKTNFNILPLIISLIIGIVTFIVFNYIENIFIVDIVLAFIAFITSLLALTGNLENFVDIMDDFNASTDKDPYKRALYKQIKNNKK